MPLLVAVTTLAAEPGLDQWLALSSRRVERFVEELPAMTCTENLAQMRLGEGKKVLSRRQSAYDYLILVDAAGSDFGVNESRLEKGKPQKEPAQPLLATSGFATLLLVLHPHFHRSFRYRLLQPDPGGEKPQQVIAFEHQPGTPSPTLLEVRGREYPIAWRGTAWIDPDTGMVSRIHAELQEPLEDIGLVGLEAEARYEPVTFGLDHQSLWLPRTAAVEVHTRRQHWRNTHDFTAYRRFEVSTATRTGGIVKP